MVQLSATFRTHSDDWGIFGFSILSCRRS